MDVIALGKANKAKRAMKKINDRLGEGVKDIHANVKTRLEEIEKKDPQVPLYNRVSDVEKNTAVNLNKHNLHINTILNKNKFGLTELAFDDFADDTGIDASKSSGHSFDLAGRKMKIANGQTQASVVTTPEQLDTVPQMITVSQSFNEQNTISVPVNLASGTLTDVEIVNGKIQLKKIGEVVSGITGNIIPTMNSNTSGSPIVVSASTENGASSEAYRAFDKNRSTRWNSTNTTSWLKVDFGQAKKIEKYTLDMGDGTSNGFTPSGWKLEASNDNFVSEIVVLDTKLSITWGAIRKKEYSITPSTSYRYYRLNFTGANDGTTQLLIYEVEMMESNVQNLHSPSGSYESPVLDLGDNFKSLKKVESLLSIPAGTNLKVFTSTSNDGITFNDYLLLNSDGTIASPSARYVKVKAELTGGGEVKEKVAHDFLNTEWNAFQQNDKLLLDGSLKMKTAYSDPMTRDSGFIESGIVFRKTIDKASFKAIEKVEVK